MPLYTNEQAYSRPVNNGLIAIGCTLEKQEKPSDLFKVLVPADLDALVTEHQALVNELKATSGSILLVRELEKLFKIIKEDLGSSEEPAFIVKKNEEVYKILSEIAFIRNTNVAKLTEADLTHCIDFSCAPMRKEAKVKRIAKEKLVAENCANADQKYEELVSRMDTTVIRAKVYDPEAKTKKEGDYKLETLITLIIGEKNDPDQKHSELSPVKAEYLAAALNFIRQPDRASAERLRVADSKLTFEDQSLKESFSERVKSKFKENRVEKIQEILSKEREFYVTQVISKIPGEYHPPVKQKDDGATNSNNQEKPKHGPNNNN